MVTPIYHPNIDSAGLICLDLLKSPPSGTWRPIHNIATLVTSLRQLLLAPNPSDPLMPEIAKEWISNKSAFEAKAREWTRKYAYGSLSNGKEQN
ncbi:hypothetical protein HAZT_HAZT000344 [Hyalella azteca]|uniref:UBC core domain-containing protein n=1 Tax=Hyalella azteca TaxID=294128 RepID=A0A6A0HBE5_HYAAZ|nr:hypothetical protein HAZT_HAZT000344 [Hyalella azteca]